jgi:hypothetical protein
MPDRFLKPFAELGASPRGLWYVMGAFVVESTAYFGILTLMTTYFSHDLHWLDTYAGIVVGIFTMLVTFFMLGVGSFAESFGLRRAIAVALLLSTTGRAVYCLLPDLPGQGAVAGVAVLSLLLVAAGSGILQPTCYSGVKQFTDERTSSLGYAMIYGNGGRGDIWPYLGWNGSFLATDSPEAQYFLEARGNRFTVVYSSGTITTFNGQPVENRAAGFTVLFDGRKKVVPPAAPGEPLDIGLARFEVSEGRHRLQIGAVNQGTLYLHGVVVEKASPGVVVYNISPGRLLGIQFHLAPARLGQTAGRDPARSDDHFPQQGCPARSYCL